MSSYSGVLIPISLFEGILVEVALAMSVAGALRRRREERATRLAESDPLTGLLNRRGFEARTRDVQQSGGSLLLIDIDNFKTINDCFGHQGGDRLLVDLAAFLRLRLPGSAISARLGGDEFVVLLPGMDEGRSLGLAEDLCSGFAMRQGRQLRHAQHRLRARDSGYTGPFARHAAGRPGPLRCEEQRPQSRVVGAPSLRHGDTGGNPALSHRRRRIITYRSLTGNRCTRDVLSRAQTG
ncbi:GGDEF domain-containing protein [Novosphingobium resinovorum]